MKSIQNLLQWLNDNWATVVTCVVLVYGIYKRATKLYIDWQNATEEERQKQIQEAEQKAIEAAREALTTFILALVSKAEIDWHDFGSKLGPIKRAQVINEIYKQYPIFEKVADQKELLDYIDKLIDSSLEIVREKVRNVGTNI